MVIDYIIPVITAGIGAGAWELYKNITNRKAVSKQMHAEAKQAQAEADKASVDAVDSKHDAIEDNLHRAIDRMEAELQQRKEEKDMLETHLKQKSEMINDMQEKHASQLSELMDKYQERLDNKQATIDAQGERINDLTSSVTALTILRCERQDCLQRLPPWGYSGVDIKKGLLVRESEASEEVAEEG